MYSSVSLSLSLIGNPEDEGNLVTNLHFILLMLIRSSQTSRALLQRTLFRTAHSNARIIDSRGVEIPLTRISFSLYHDMCAI